jgi:hypothetical protein
MNSAMKEIYKFLKDEKSLNQNVLKEELQPITSGGYEQEMDLITEPALSSADDIMIEDDVVAEDPSLLLDPALNFESSSVEQKKVMLIDYFDKLIDKVVIVRDHIDTLSFDSVISSNTVIGASQLQFNLEELKGKISKYIEDQYEADKYERSLYVYLSFMEELKLIVKLLQKQAKKL